MNKDVCNNGIFIDETDETENRKIHFERYPSKTIERVSILIHIRNDGDRVPLPTTSPLFLSLIPISSLLHRRYSTVNNIDSVIYPTIQNHSLRYQATKEERNGEEKKGGREGGKREVEEKEREKKKEKTKEKYTRRGGRKKRGRYLHSRDLKYPEAFRIRYLTLSSSLSPPFPSPSLPPPEQLLYLSA